MSYTCGYTVYVDIHISRNVSWRNYGDSFITNELKSLCVLKYLSRLLIFIIYIIKIKLESRNPGKKLILPKYLELHR